MEIKVHEQLWFTTPIWECALTNIDNGELKDYCLQTQEKTQGITISNRGGWHSKEILYPIADPLAKLFDEVNKFANEVCIRYTGIKDLVIGNFWINVNGYHDYNIEHDHQKSILSGVYYVSVPANNMGNIVFHRGDNAQYFLTSDIEREQTKFNAITCSKPPKESTFYLFPSWIKHSVERNESKKKRISIAFNLVPQSKIV
jgi:uncharacterized protein (TIGR02466 family)